MFEKDNRPHRHWPTYLKLNLLAVQIYDASTELDTNSVWGIRDD